MTKEVGVGLKCFVAVACTTVVGCGLLTPAPAPPAGFIPEPAVMAEHRERAPFQKAWFADRDGFAALKREVHKLVVRPVDTSHLLASTSWRDISSLGGANDPADVREIADYMRERFVAAVRDHPSHAMEVVEEAGQKTFVLELSLVELNPTKVAVNAAGTAAGLVVPGGGLLSVAGKGSVAFEAILKNGETGEPLVTRFAKHLRNHLEQWFTFVFDPTVEPTNWKVEQAIRPAVVNRKVWGGNRTWVGADAQGVLMSVFETCRRHARSALDFVSLTLRSFGNRSLQRPVLT